MKRGRLLSKEDKLLWWHVTRQVTPLARDLEPMDTEAAAPAPVTAPALAVEARQPAPKRPAPALDALDSSLRRKVHRGRQDIEGRLDLHGLRQEEAHRTLMQFLRQSQALQRRLVIVITGKGQPARAVPAHEAAHHWNPAGEERGVLRRLVPHWLKMAEARPYVVGFEAASRQHGGEGALYVHIRRLKD